MLNPMGRRQGNQILALLAEGLIAQVRNSDPRAEATEFSVIDLVRRKDALRLVTRCQSKVRIEATTGTGLPHRA